MHVFIYPFELFRLLSFILVVYFERIGYCTHPISSYHHFLMSSSQAVNCGFTSMPKTLLTLLYISGKCSQCNPLLWWSLSIISPSEILFLSTYCLFPIACPRFRFILLFFRMYTTDKEHDIIPDRIINTYVHTCLLTQLTSRVTQSA